MVRDAGGRITLAANKTHLWMNESTGEAGNLIIASIHSSLEGIGKYSKEGMLSCITLTMKV